MCCFIKCRRNTQPHTHSHTKKTKLKLEFRTLIGQCKKKKNLYGTPQTELFSSIFLHNQNSKNTFYAIILHHPILYNNGNK